MSIWTQLLSRFNKPDEEETNELKESFQKHCVEAAQAIQECDVLLVVTGAGFSADSGLAVYNDVARVPAYQARDLDYSEICAPEWLYDDPELFYGFWGQCFNDYRATKPHRGYDVIAQWKRDKVGNAVGKDIQERIARKVELRRPFEDEITLRYTPYHTAPGKFASSFFSFTSNVDAHWFDVLEAEEINECHGNIEMWQCSNTYCKAGIWRAPLEHRFEVNMDTMLAPQFKNATAAEATADSAESNRDAAPAAENPEPRDAPIQDSEDDNDSGSDEDCTDLDAAKPPPQSALLFSSQPRDGAQKSNGAFVAKKPYGDDESSDDDSSSEESHAFQAPPQASAQEGSAVAQRGDDDSSSDESDDPKPTQATAQKSDTDVAHIGQTKGKTRDQTLKYMPPARNETGWNREEPSANRVCQWPKCWMCQEAARPAILMFGDFGWKRDAAQGERWSLWEEAVLEACEHRQEQDSEPMKVCIFEVGCGLNVPTCRMNAERIAARVERRGGEVKLIRVNPDFPLGDEDVQHCLIPIMARGLETIEQIDKAYQSMA